MIPKKQTRSVVATGSPITNETTNNAHVPTRASSFLSRSDHQNYIEGIIIFDAPHISVHLLFCLATVVVFGCSSLTQFEFSLNDAFEIPGRQAASIPPGRVIDGGFSPDQQGYDQLRPAGFVDLDLTAQPAFRENSVAAQHVESLHLLDIILTAQPESVRDPFAYLDGIRFVAIVADQEIELAALEGEALSGAARVVTLPGTSADLKVLLSAAATISVRLRGRQPLGNRAFTVQARFVVDLF
jgi:hypothetical protein